MFAKIGSWFAIHDEDDEEQQLYADEVGAKRNVVPLSDASRRAGGSVAVFAPRSFGDVTEIADALRTRQVVIVNVQGADRNLLQRVVDFTSGVAYTIDGRIQKLAEAIYLIVPAGVNVNSAGVREQLDNDGILGLKDFR
ncbi:MAG TPA: cell division protein SepF [Candidatus Limnocylindria bacterium]|jgi:cell division inhibitor SepF|nr:cell division protein SepF [Candidatus Limnocylindria bacterium]